MPQIAKGARLYLRKRKGRDAVWVIRCGPDEIGTGCGAGDISGAHKALEAYLAAYQLRPTRAEPLCELARHYRQEKQYPLAHLFARRAQEIQRPNDILFLDESVYAWRAIDELGVAAYYVGRHEEALAAADLLLGGGRLPETELARVTENRKFAVDALGTSLLPKKHSKGKKPHKQKNKKRR